MTSDKIILKSAIFIVAEILKPTKAILFRDLDVGSNIRFSLKLGRQGSGRGLYAVDISVVNIKTGDCVIKSMTELDNILKNFVIKEFIDDDVEFHY